MKKTGKTYLNLFSLIIFCFLFTSGNALAQDVNVNATLNSTEIIEGETVLLEVEVINNTTSGANRPQLPNIEGLRLLPNRTSQSTSITYVNNKMTATTSYGFQLVAEKAGNYTVPPIEVDISDEIYKTEPISFKILDKESVNLRDSNNRPDIYVELEANNYNPVVGEQVIVSLVLYFKQGIDVNSYQALPGWKAEGFWKEDLDLRRQAQQTTTIVDNVRYQKATLMNYAIFPTKTGKLTLSPFSINVRVRENRSFFDSNFGFNFGGENKELSTLPIELNVEKLPEIDDDAISISAVGDFEIKRSISKNKALVGESIEITTETTGTGNLPLINKPQYKIPDGIEEYSPQEKTDLNRANNIISGSKTFTDIIVPRRNGEFEIPALKIAVFNPKSKKFNYINLTSLSFEAENDPNAKHLPQVSDNQLNITPYNGLVKWHSNKKSHLWNTTFYLFLIPIPFIILLGAFIYKKQYDRMNNDIVFSRSRKAYNNAVQILDDAKKTNNIKEGYNFIQNAINGFISDKLNLPKSGLSTKELTQHLEGKIAENDLSVLVKLINKCETITFAPVILQQDLKSDIAKAENLISSLNKTI